MKPALSALRQDFTRMAGRACTTKLPSWLYHVLNGVRPAIEMSVYTQHAATVEHVARQVEGGDPGRGVLELLMIRDGLQMDIFHASRGFGADILPGRKKRLQELESFNDQIEAIVGINTPVKRLYTAFKLAADRAGHTAFPRLSKIFRGVPPSLEVAAMASREKKTSDAMRALETGDAAEATASLREVRDELRDEVRDMRSRLVTKVIPGRRARLHAYEGYQRQVEAVLKAL